MTTSTTSAFVFNIGEMARMAHVDAGLLHVSQSLTPGQRSDAIDKLTRMSMGTQAKGVFARVADFKTVTLAAGSSLYAMTADVLDVYGPGMYLAAGSTAEIQVEDISRERWHEIADKTTSGPPNMYFPVRTADLLSVQVWQVPGAAEAGGTIRFQGHRFRADSRDANATADFERFWTDWIVAELAYRLAMSNTLSPERCRMLRADAGEKLRECKGMSNERVGNQFSVGHKSGWAGR